MACCSNPRSVSTSERHCRVHKSAAGDGTHRSPPHQSSEDHNDRSQLRCDCVRRVVNSAVTWLSRSTTFASMMALLRHKASTCSRCGKTCGLAR